MPYELRVIRAVALKDIRPERAGDPRVRQALGELSGKFTDAAMRKLNYAVDGTHRPVREVADSTTEIPHN